MRLLTTKTQKEVIVSKIYNFSAVNEVWTFTHQDIGAEIWLEIKRKQRKQTIAKRKEFRFSITQNHFVIWRKR